MGAFQRLEDGKLDELLSGIPPADESLAGLAAFVADVRAVSEEPVPESLAARHVARAAGAVEVSVGARRPASEVLRPRNRWKVVRRSSPVTLAAKVAAAILALAAMTAGAAGAGVLPDPVQQFVADTAARIGLEFPQPEPPEPPQSQSLPEEALLGQEEAERKHLAAEAYAEAVQDWTDCVAENAAAQGDHEARQPDPFDPTEGCGEKPDPMDFGITEPPAAMPQGPPEEAPQGPPEGAADGPPEEAPQGPPEEAPQGPPEEAADGPPEEAADGPPEGTPQGPPDGAPQGPPGETPPGGP
jgi:hypothetical protein